MKYSVNNYVGAFTQAVKKSSQEQVVASFAKLLKKTGDIKHSQKVIEAIHKKLVNEKGGKWVNIETARELALKKEKLKHNFSAKDHIDFKINPELIAGVLVTVNGEEELNNSLRSKLNKLFK